MNYRNTADEWMRRQLEHNSVTKEQIDELMNTKEKSEEIHENHFKTQLKETWFYFKLSLKLLVNAIFPTKYKIDVPAILADREMAKQTAMLVKATAGAAEIFRKMPHGPEPFRAAKTGHIDMDFAFGNAHHPYVETGNPYGHTDPLEDAVVEDLVETRKTKK